MIYHIWYYHPNESGLFSSPHTPYQATADDHHELNRIVRSCRSKHYPIECIFARDNNGVLQHTWYAEKGGAL